MTAKIVPFRGEYYKLSESAQSKIRHLVYPVPDPSFPFLGVHFTRMIQGGVECGPNAVLAYDREGYDPFSFSLRDTLETLSYPGFWRIAAKHWKTGAQEVYRSLSKRAFLRALQKLVPSLTLEEIEFFGSGIRAQALSTNGQLLDDFVIETQGAQTHVLNAPSPAATSALAIGQEIAARALGT